jgi:hypothetical protein
LFDALVKSAGFGAEVFELDNEFLHVLVGRDGVLLETAARCP